MINYPTWMQASVSTASSASALATPAQAGSTTAGARAVARPRAEAPIPFAVREKSALRTVGVQHRADSVMGSDQNPFGLGTPVGVGVRRDVAAGVHSRGKPVRT